MAHDVSSNSSLCFVATLTIILILAVAFAARAQVAEPLLDKALPLGANHVHHSSGIGFRGEETASTADSATPLFLPVVTYDAGGMITVSLSLADLNADGRPDLVVVNPNGTTGVLLGNGDGTFKPVVLYNSGYSSASVAIADMNGDGHLDVVVADSCAAIDNCQRSAINLLLGTGDGTLRAPTSYDAGPGQTQSVAAGDVNGDGKPDLVVANWSGGVGFGESAVGIMLGNGDGTFQPVLTYDSGANSDSVTIADLNGDDKPDLLLGDSDTVAVFLGNGDGTFRPKVEYKARIAGSYPSGIGTVAIADLNGDGKPDIAAACAGSGSNGDGSVAVLLANGEGTFQPAVNYDSGSTFATSVKVADVDGDGKLDLAVSNYGWADPVPRTLGSVGVLLGNGDGTFRPAVTYYSGGEFAISLATADLNGDGSPDLAVANQWGDVNGHAVGVLLNNSNFKQTPTQTTVASSLDPSVYGQPVMFTVEVTATSGTPAGTVTLFDGTSAVASGTLSNGITRLVPLLPVGADSITAAYQGSAAFAPSKSAPLPQTVISATTTTTLAPFITPAATAQPITFTATVTSQFGGVATGTVAFFAGLQTLGTASLSANRATLTTSFAAAGDYSISAKYIGDGNNTGSVSPVSTQRVIAATTTRLVSSPNPSTVRQPVSFTATVNSTGGIPPDGEPIAFKNGSTTLATVPLRSGIASFITTALPAGTFSITATFGGDSDFTASTSTSVRQVVRSTNRSATSASLVSSLNPSIYGQAVTWMAMVTTSGSVPPTGNVAFRWSRDGRNYTIGTATLNANGVATLSRPNLNADPFGAPYPLVAVYAGDAMNLGSTSAVLPQHVLQTRTAASISSSVNPSGPGQAVTFTATITSPTVTPTGPVTFTVGKQVLGTAQIVPRTHKATLAISTLPVGSSVIRATYLGDSNISRSSASVTQIVQ